MLRGQTDELLIKDVHSRPAMRLQHTDTVGALSIHLQLAVLGTACQLDLECHYSHNTHKLIQKKEEKRAEDQVDSFEEFN